MKMWLHHNILSRQPSIYRIMKKTLLVVVYGEEEDGLRSFDEKKRSRRTNEAQCFHLFRVSLALLLILLQVSVFKVLLSQREISAGACQQSPALPSPTLLRSVEEWIVLLRKIRV